MKESEKIILNSYVIRGIAAIKAVVTERLSPYAGGGT